MYNLWDITNQKTCNILMIGNSFCQFYLDELLAMTESAGIPCRISCLIAGACTLVQHWTWCETNEKRYRMHTYNAAGFTAMENIGLQECLEQAEWDIISYQDGEHYYRLGGMESAAAHTEPYLGNLVKYVRERFPDAVHCFHQVWAYQVGYNRPEKSPFQVPDEQSQDSMHQDLRTLSLEACTRHALIRIPSGDAWYIARKDPRIGDTLCMNDCEHDGETGGQYLNACVWFDMLFGFRHIGKTFQSKYDLTEEKKLALQSAAQEAVMGVKKAGCTQ